MNDIVIPNPVPMHLWARDHWSTFAYAGHVATSQKHIDKDKMRTDADRHPHGVGYRQSMFSDHRTTKYPTRLTGGREINDHDDWDCLDDAEAAGLLTWGTWVNPFVVLTTTGLQAFAQIMAYENDPETSRKWSKLMQSWRPPTGPVSEEHLTRTGVESADEEFGNAVYSALHPTHA